MAMLKHWIRHRKASLLIHGIYAAGWLIAGAISAGLFWHELFQSILIAVGLVASVELLALVGLGCKLASIPSPFQPLRHVLPYISVLPLGYELHKILTAVGNPLWVSLLTVVVVASIAIFIAWRCWGTIEMLFNDPVKAAQEQAKEQVGVFKIELAALTAKEQIVDEYVFDRVRSLLQNALPGDIIALTNARTSLDQRSSAAHPALIDGAPTLKAEQVSVPEHTCPLCGRAIKSARARGAIITNGGCCAECRAEQAAVKVLEHKEETHERTATS